MSIYMPVDMTCTCPFPCPHTRPYIRPHACRCTCKRTCPWVVISTHASMHVSTQTSTRSRLLRGSAAWTHGSFRQKKECWHGSFFRQKRECWHGSSRQKRSAGTGAFGSGGPFVPEERRAERERWRGRASKQPRGRSAALCFFLFALFFYLLAPSSATPSSRPRAAGA